MAQHLTVKSVVETALEKFDELAGVYGSLGCYYTDSSGRHCLIGASLNEETLSLISQNMWEAKNINYLFTVKAVTADDFDAEKTLRVLQRSHDFLVHRANWGTLNPAVAVCFRSPELVAFMTLHERDTIDAATLKEFLTLAAKIL